MDYINFYVFITASKLYIHMFIIFNMYFSHYMAWSQHQQQNGGDAMGDLSFSLSIGHILNIV